MRVTVLTFDPETVGKAIQRVQLLLDRDDPQLDFVYPSIDFEQLDDLDSAVADELRRRMAGLTPPVRVLHVQPAAFLEQLMGSDPPALVVVAYTQWSERVAMTTTMLAMRNFPTMMIGYRP